MCNHLLDPSECALCVRGRERTRLDLREAKVEWVAPEFDPAEFITVRLDDVDQKIRWTATRRGGWQSCPSDTEYVPVSGDGRVEWDTTTFTVTRTPGIVWNTDHPLAPWQREATDPDDGPVSLDALYERIDADAHDVALEALEETMELVG